MSCWIYAFPTGSITNGEYFCLSGINYIKRILYLGHKYMQFPLRQSHICEHAQLSFHNLHKRRNIAHKSAPTWRWNMNRTNLIMSWFKILSQPTHELVLLFSSEEYQQYQTYYDIAQCQRWKTENPFYCQIQNPNHFLPLKAIMLSNADKSM